jgi:hypothetical protein
MVPRKCTYNPIVSPFLIHYFILQSNGFGENFFVVSMYVISGQKYV